MQQTERSAQALRSFALVRRTISSEVVQLHVQHLGSMADRPRLELKGFKRVRIEPGAEQNGTLELKPRDLAYWDAVRHAWRVEKEQVRVLAGESSDQLPVEGVVEVATSAEFKP